MASTGDEVDPASVFVVHGRNQAARDAVFGFLRSVGLRPLEWSQALALTGSGAPYIGDVLDRAFAAARAVVVLMTPDEIAYLRSEYSAGPEDLETAPAAQARPNVLFEAGMAFGRHPDRTILVEMGSVRSFSDVAGRHVVHLSNEPTVRKDLAQRLQQAGCPVDLSGADWLTVGDLSAPPPPGGGLPLGKRVPGGPRDATVRISARYSRTGTGAGHLQLTNHSGAALRNLTVELPREAGHRLHIMQDGPILKLPAGETATLRTSMTMGAGSDHFELLIHAETVDGTPIDTTAFVDLAAG